MRSALMGAYFADDPVRRRAFVAFSSFLTHRSWQAETAALAVAESVAWTVRAQGQTAPDAIIDLTRNLSDQPEWQRILTQMKSSLNAGHAVRAFAQALGLEKGVTGYSLQVVPVALFAWMRFPGDFRTALIGALVD